MLFVLLMFLSKTLNAQYNTNFLNYSSMGRSVSANLDFEAGSNGMSTPLVNKLFWGGYISKDVKDQSAKHLKASNNFGLLLDYDVNAFVKGNYKFDYLIGVKSQDVLNATYTRDFYNLLFYGNGAYKGKTANIGNSSVNALRFNQVTFGAVLHKVDSVGKIGISVSLIQGQQLFDVKTNANSSLYTSPDGTELIFNSNFNMALSDTTRKNPLSFNGIGASADIFFETPYKSRIGKRSVLIVNANNLGFIHWQNNSVQYSSDSSLRYTGYNIHSINDLRDSTINRLKSDSLVQNLSNARHQSFNVNIPTNLVILNKVYFSEIFSLTLGFRHIFNANYVPYVFLEPEYKYKNFIFGLHTGYGGYVRLNVGANITWNSKAWFLRLGSNSLQGYFFPNITYGQGLYLSLAKKIK